MNKNFGNSKNVGIFALLKYNKAKVQKEFDKNPKSIKKLFVKP
jgi:hypothetical protein